MRSDQDRVRGAGEARARARCARCQNSIARVQHDADDGQDPRGRRRQEVVGEADEEAVLDDDGALVADEQQDDAVPAPAGPPA